MQDRGSPAKPFTWIVATTSWVSKWHRQSCLCGLLSRPWKFTQQDWLCHQMPKLTIAIDGPAGSGKSSLAKRVAQILGYLYLDSGAMYRALALKALREKISLDNCPALDELARDTHIELK